MSTASEGRVFGEVAVVDHREEERSYQPVKEIASQVKEEPWLLAIRTCPNSQVLDLSSSHHDP